MNGSDVFGGAEALAITGHTSIFVGVNKRYIEITPDASNYIVTIGTDPTDLPAGGAYFIIKNKTVYTFTVKDKDGNRIGGKYTWSSGDVGDIYLNADKEWVSP